MIELIVFLFSSRLPRSRRVFRICVKFVDGWYQNRGKNLNFDATRFEKSSWVASRGDRESGHKDKSIELLVVSTYKDFDILFYSVTAALKALSQYRSGGVRIIVPKRDLAACISLFARFNEQVLVVDEETFISRKQFERLTQSFGTRNTWVLQQLLKVQAVLNSESDAVLILDSDTILFRKRPWFDQEGRQILTPSNEFNAPYYSFLNKLGISDSEPQHSFISHHMIMQPRIFKLLLEELGLFELNSLINYCCLHSDKSVQSPICIEYELYGQYIGKEEKNLSFFARWSSVTIPKKYSRIVLKSKLLQKILSYLFNSISFHSWS